MADDIPVPLIQILDDAFDAQFVEALLEGDAESRMVHDKASGVSSSISSFGQLYPSPGGRRATSEVGDRRCGFVERIGPGGIDFICGAADDLARKALAGYSSKSDGK